MLEPTPMKRCAKCGEDKPHTLAFFYAAGSKAGIDSTCKVCRVEVVRQKKLAAGGLRRVLIPIVDGVKACAECGESKPATREYFYGSNGRLTRACISCEHKKRKQKRDAYLATAEAIQDGFKICSKCGKEKPATLEFFGVHKRRASGMQKFCKECHTISGQRATNARIEKYGLKPVEVSERECIGCSRTLPLDAKHFNRAKNYRAGFGPRCKDCRSTDKAKEYEKVKSDPERYKALRTAQKTYVAANRLTVRKSEKRWREKNPLKVRASRLLNAQKRAEAPGSFDKHDLRRQFAEQRGCCFYCGVRVGRGEKIAWHIEHFIPISRGGTNYPENIRIACQPCNNSKAAKMPWEWMPERFSPPADIQAGHKDVECV